MTVCGSSGLDADLMGRRFALVSALLVIVLLAVLTIVVAVRDGIDILVIVSLLIIALLGSAVLGALTNRPDE